MAAAVKNAVRYGSQGAALGSTFGPWGTAIGGGIGAVFGALFGQDEEEIRQERYQKFLEVLAGERRNAIDAESKRNTGLIQQMTAGAARRAASTGRSASNIEDYTLPAAAQGARMQSEGLRNINAEYAKRVTEAEYEFAQRPIEPNALDYLMTAGGVASDIYNQQRFLDVMGGSSESGKTGGGTASAAPAAAPDMAPVMNVGSITPGFRDKIGNWGDENEPIPSTGLVKRRPSRVTPFYQ